MYWGDDAVSFTSNNPSWPSKPLPQLYKSPISLSANV